MDVKHSRTEPRETARAAHLQTINGLMLVPSSRLTHRICQGDDPPGHVGVQAFSHPLRYFVAVMTWPLILPDTGPSPKRAAMAWLARSVTRSSKVAFLASISLRNGVPWQ